MMASNIALIVVYSLCFIACVDGLMPARRQLATRLRLFPSFSISKSVNSSSASPIWLNDGFRSAIASGLATAFVKTILQPFDAIKTVQQAQYSKLNPVQAGIMIYNTRGIRGLWSGTGISVLGSAPSSAVYFGIYSSLKTMLKSYLPKNFDLLSVCIAAFAGNTAASFLRVPNEVIKQRLQAGVHATVFEALLYSWKVEGILGIYGHGRLKSQILRDVPYAMITLVAYEILQSLAFISKNGNSNKTLISKSAKDAICGALAGGLGSLMTHPLDVVKTRMMTSSKYLSIWDALYRIWIEEGFGTYFAGLTPRLIHKIPANGLFFLCYEFFKTLFGVISPNS